MRPNYPRHTSLKSLKIEINICSYPRYQIASLDNFLVGHNFHGNCFGQKGGIPKIPSFSKYYNYSFIKFAKLKNSFFFNFSPFISIVYTIQIACIKPFFFSLLNGILDVLISQQIKFYESTFREYLHRPFQSWNCLLSHFVGKRFGSSALTSESHSRNTEKKLPLFILVQKESKTASYNFDKYVKLALDSH